MRSKKVGRHPNGKPIVFKYLEPLYWEGTLKKDNIERKVVLCQTPIVDEQFMGEMIMNTVGIAILNPIDENDSDIGYVIAEGRALKSPVKETVIISKKRLPQILRDEQLVWTAKHVERNLDKYVLSIRDVLKKDG